MKVQILHSDLIELIPESDADSALISLWSNQQARTVSSRHENGRISDLLIEFKDSENAVAPQAERGL